MKGKRKLRTLDMITIYFHSVHSFTLVKNFWQKRGTDNQDQFSRKVLFFWFRTHTPTENFNIHIKMTYFMQDEQIHLSSYNLYCFFFSTPKIN